MGTNNFTSTKSYFSNSTWRTLSFLGFAAIVIVGVEAWHRFVPPTPLFFMERDPALSFPYRHDTVPGYALFLVGWIVPALIIGVTARFFSPMTGTVLVDWSGSSSSGAIAIAYWRRTAREAAMVAFTAVTLAFATNTLITEAVKTMSSKPRPSFFAQCNYKGFLDAQNSGNWSAYDAATTLNHAGDTNDCMATSALITDSQASFPSGHSSISFVGCTFLSLWLGALSALWFGLEPWPWAWMPWTLRPWWASPVDAGFDQLWSGDRLGPGTPPLDELEGGADEGAICVNAAAAGQQAPLPGSRAAASGSDDSAASTPSSGGRRLLGRGTAVAAAGGEASTVAPRSPIVCTPAHASAALASAQEDFETAASIAALPFSCTSLAAQAAATLVVGAPIALAAWVASSRVHDYKHHVYDTLAGGVIGMAIALVTWQWFITAPAFVRWAAMWQGARARHTGGQRAKFQLGVRSGVQHSALSGLMERIA